MPDFNGAIKKLKVNVEKANLKISFRSVLFEFLDLISPPHYPYFI
jgi:hypothetical protein